MENFKIKVQLTAKDFAKATFAILSRKGFFYFLMICGLMAINQIGHNYGGTIGETAVLAVALFLILLMPILTFIAVRKFKSSPNFEYGTIYTFSDNGVILEGPVFKNELTWINFTMQKEYGKFLMLYLNRQTCMVIDKTKLTTEQLNFIKSKIK